MSDALTEDEIDELAVRLAANQTAGALTLEGVDGLFCALIAGPTLVRPSEYLPVILGADPGASPAFADLKDAQDSLSLLLRYWNSIVADFASDEPVHLPYIIDLATGDIPGREWAQAFMRGTRLAPAGWSRLFHEQNEGQVISIPMVAGEIDPAWPKEPLTAEKRDEVLRWMIAGAARAYRYFAPDRRAMAEQAQFSSVGPEGDPDPYVRTEPKVGRNDPCPCGSGKKFKKCCGAADRGALN
jgi:uncharacterized protein